MEIKDEGSTLRVDPLPAKVKHNGHSSDEDSEEEAR